MARRFCSQALLLELEPVLVSGIFLARTVGRRRLHCYISYSLAKERVEVTAKLCESSVLSIGLSLGFHHVGVGVG